MKKSILLISLLILAAVTPAMATTFVVEYVGVSGAGGLNKPAGPTAPTLPPGLYVNVLDGVIQASNLGGSQSFSAGQFGYTPNFSSPPAVVPANPGVKFTPPPVFNSSTTSSSAADPASKANAVDCEVR